MYDAEYPCHYLKLPLQVDVPRIEAELHALQHQKWLSHVNTSDYLGTWQCLALRSIGGVAGNMLAVDDADYQDTEALAHCPYLREVLDSFACEKASVRLMALEAGAVIKPHRDPGGAFEDGIARLHIPLQTHPDVTFGIEQQTVHFSAGDCWYLNAACTHAVYNRSPMTRIHLMLDCKVNPWLEQLFLRNGFVARVPAPYGDPSIDDNNVLLIIEQLRSSATPGGLAAAQRLENLYSAR